MKLPTPWLLLAMAAPLCAQETLLPAAIELGRSAEELRPVLAEACEHTEERDYTGEMAAPFTEQTQIDCFGLEVFGRARKAEFLFNDGPLGHVWILIEAGETEEVTRKLAAEFGPVVYTSEIDRVFESGTVAVRSDPPEVLVAGPELVEALTGYRGEKETGAVDVNPAFEPLAWLIGEWRGLFRPAGEDRAAPTMAFAWGDARRSYLKMSGMSPTADGGLEPEYDGFVIWHPIRGKFVFVTSYRSSAGKVVEDGDIDLLEEDAVRLNMYVHYPAGSTQAFGADKPVGPEGLTVAFRRTFYREGDGRLRGVFRVERNGEWVIPGKDSKGEFLWERLESR